MAEQRNDLAALSVRRPYLVAVINLLIIVAGLSAILGVEVRELPDIDRPVVTVRANYAGGSPETIDAELTSKVEAAVARVSGVVEVRSSSEEGNFRIRAVFLPTTDLIAAANDVREAVNRVQRQLPDGVEDLFVIKADTDARAIVRLSATSPSLAIEELSRKIETEVVPELMAVSGVADVTIFGSRERVLRVVIDPMRLASYGLSVGDVVNVLRTARLDVPSGSFKSDEQEIIVRADASVEDPSAIERLVIRDPVKIGDVATAYFGPADPESIVRLNSQSVVNLGIVRRAQSNTVAISQGVSAAVERLNRRLPDVRIVTTSDDSVFIMSAVTEVLLSLGLAVVIVIGVIAIFLRKLRAALIPAVTIPVALIGTVALIWLFGFSINLITLLALVLATGLVVDDAIVVLENIERLKAQGVQSRAAAVLGSRQVFFAVVATTATLISVFLPISFLPSTAGRLFTEFGVVLAVAVCISSFVALSIVPMIASRFRTTEGAVAERPGPLSFLGGVLEAAYGRVLRGVVAAPLVVVGLCAIAVSAAAIVYGGLNEELVPEEDRGQISVRLTGPDGVGLDYTDRQVERVEAIIQPYVDRGVATSMLSITGRYDPNRGQVTAPLADWSERTISEGQIAREINRKLNQVPGARARMRRGNSLNLRNADGGIRFALTGADYEKIAVAARALVAKMETHVPQVENLRVEFRATQPQISLNIDRQRATDLGVSLDSLTTTVRALVDKDEVGELTINDQRVPIIVQAIDGAIRDPAGLRNLYISASDGRLVPLSQLITMSERAVPGELDRHGQRRAVEIFGDTVDGVALRDAVTAIEKLAKAELPPDIGLLFLDEAAALNETSSGMAITFLIAFVIVFLVLVAQFESVPSALVVLLTVPLGVCAAVFALGLTGTSINIYSQIGVLMLIGIMAKNAILMVEFADQLRERGMSVAAAATEASMVR
ncbi:MAG: efflux RND transporter permease subunit, partial [Pseudomonadota bacterium]